MTIATTNSINVNPAIFLILRVISFAFRALAPLYPCLTGTRRIALQVGRQSGRRAAHCLCYEERLRARRARRTAATTATATAATATAAAAATRGDRKWGTRTAGTYTIGDESRRTHGRRRWEHRFRERSTGRRIH